MFESFGRHPLVGWWCTYELLPIGEQVTFYPAGVGCHQVHCGLAETTRYFEWRPIKKGVISLRWLPADADAESMQNDEAPEERDEFGWETHQYGFEVCEADGHKTRTVWTTFGVPSYSDPVRYQCCPIFEAPQTRLIYPTANEQTQIDSVDRGSVAERYFTLAIICFGVGIGIGRIAWDEGSTISWSIASIFGLAGMLFGLLSFRTAWA